MNFGSHACPLCHNVYSDPDVADTPDLHDCSADVEVTLNLKIENHYDGDVITTRATVTVPAPPVDDEDEADDWEQDYIFPATGTGQTEGDSAYFVEVTASSNPDLISVGAEYEFGL